MIVSRTDDRHRLRRRLGRQKQSALICPLNRGFSPLFVLVCFLMVSPPSIPLQAFAATDVKQTSEGPRDERGAFAGSQLIPATDEVVEGETITYTLNVRYNGTEPLRSITVVYRLPEPVMLVSSSPPIEFDEEHQRQLTWKEEIGPGQQLRFTIAVITVPESASRGVMIASAGILWRPLESEWEVESHWLQSETKIRSRPRRILYTLPNGIGIGNVELVLTAYLVLGPVLILLIPTMILRREKRRASQHKGERPRTKMGRLFLFPMSFAFVFALGIAHLMGSIALDDIRRFVAYEKTSCILLDKRIILEEGRSTSRAPGPGRLTHTTVYNEPLVAVSYPVRGRQIVAAGMPRPTSLLSPLDKYALRELAQYERGRAYPCWYDPMHPETFVLARGISWGWYLLGIGPMILLFFLGRYFLLRLKG